MAKRTRSAAERAAQAESLRARPARGKILAAATALAEARGYEAIRVGELAERAGVSRETFYTHFPDKRSCLAEATAPRLGEIEQLLRIAGEEGAGWAQPILAAVDEQLSQRFGADKGPRARIIAAMVELVGDGGYAAVRLADVVKAAHVSYPSFYRYFENKKECFARSCRWLIEGLRREIELAESVDEAKGPERVGLVALAELLRAEPRTAEILLIEAGELQRRGADRGHGPEDGDSGATSGSPPASLKDLVAELLPRTLHPTIPAGGRAATELIAGAITETMREAALHDELEELPDRVASLLFVLGRPSGEQAEQRSPRSRPRRTRERRSAAARARGRQAAAA